MAKKRRQPKGQRPKKNTAPHEPRVEPTAEVQAMPHYSEHNKVWRNNRQLALDHYRNQPRGGINEPQHDAGIHLHELFTKSGMLHLATPGYWYMGEELGVKIASSGNKEEFRHDLYDRAQRAMLAVSGTIGRQIIESVCCYDVFLKDLDIPGYEKGEYKMRRFKEALDELVEHFHIPIPDELKQHYDRRWNYAHRKKARRQRRS